MAPKLSIRTKSIIMDTKLIRRYGTDILSYRIQSARQKKRLRYKDFDKQLLKLHRREWGLSRQIWNLGYEPLVPPVQKGWKRSFVLREDVARSRNAVFFENILAKINTSDWSYRKDFKVRKRRYGRKHYVVKTQFLHKLYEDDIWKIGFSRNELAYFQEVSEMDWRRQPVKRYVFKEPWRFVLRVQPNIVDKIKIIDPLLEEELEGITSYFRWNAYYFRKEKLLHGVDRWGKRDRGMEEEREWNPIRGKTLLQILDEAKEE